MRSKRLRQQRGSLLIESLFAITILAIGMSAVSTLLASQVHMDATNNTTTTAINLAETELENIRTLSYVNMVSRTSTATAGAITYTIQSTVVPDSPVQNVKSITTQVQWTEAAGPQSYTMYAYYTALQ